MDQQYVIGIDFGTDSVRAVIADTADGREISSAVYPFPLWDEGKYCNPAANQFRQHPQEYINGLENSITTALAKVAPEVAVNIKAISVDTTGSTPVAVNREGVPLALTLGFGENPNAMFVLWKDHTAIKEAEEINAHAARQNTNYLQYVGGIYSSEWFWAKALHVLRADEQVRKACYTWIEHCDWIPFLLTGGIDAGDIKRSRCAAGHKGLWNEEFGGYPPDDFFATLDPLLAGYAAWLPKETYTADEAAGNLCPEWAQRLGLSTEVIIGCGAFDAHMGAVGGQIEPYHLSKVMGTSTCDMLVIPQGDRIPLVKGICGQVNGSVIPGMTGFEAGQSSFGDVYAWFVNLLCWPLQFVADSENVRSRLLIELSKQAAALPHTNEDELALDWLNGRRTPDANQKLKAVISGLSLASDTPRIFRALAEATCFGARAIVERFRREEVDIQGITGIGGVARKSPYIMQLMADILQMPVKIHRSEQTCAAGAAMFAAVCAGIYPDAEAAMQAMGQGFDLIYTPDETKAEHYHKRYLRYQRLGCFTEEEVYEPC